MSEPTLKDGVLAALAALDAKNDDHWTENGLPRLDALGAVKITRAQLTDIAPLFNRTNSVLEDLNAKAPEAPKIEVPSQPTHDELDMLQLEVEDAEAEVRKCEDAKNVAQRAVTVAQNKRDVLVHALDKARPSHENIMGIRAVLERSKQVRAEKAGLAAELRAVGITQALLAPGSRLDQAMVRKRGFGQGRPITHVNAVKQ